MYSIPLQEESNQSVRESIQSLDEFFRDFYEQYIRNATPVVRGTPEVRLGRKYIGMVALPRYLEDALNNCIKSTLISYRSWENSLPNTVLPTPTIYFMYLDKDKKLIRVDALRIADFFDLLVS